MLLKPGRLSLIIVLLLLAACHSKKMGELRRENDSLRSQLESEHRAIATMMDGRRWLDSIDAKRNLSGIHIAEQTGKDFKNRLAHINRFVKSSQERLAIVEKSLASSTTESSAYLKHVDDVKKELQLRVNDVVRLHERLASHIIENTELQETLKVHENDVEATLHHLSRKHEQLLVLERKIQRMVNAFNVAEAEAYYAHARAMEDVAKRTRFSPQKRRQNFKEALALYKKSLSLGKEGAGADIAKLEKMMR